MITHLLNHEQEQYILHHLVYSIAPAHFMAGISLMEKLKSVPGPVIVLYLFDSLAQLRHPLLDPFFHNQGYIH